jgi:hypothetical protein
MKRLYKTKSNRLSSLISLVLLAGMVVAFSIIVPGFLSIPAGRIFAGAWAVMAIFVFTAHARELHAVRKNCVPPLNVTSLERKDVRTHKTRRAAHHLGKNALRDY